ncbi:SNF2 helicase associated domain-containing protein [Clostridium sp. CX1]|uniref:DEAD/DEAH box helicase n=1 Tax=Clostridium sp. CX1 TaxID=2978346 RepID=UPI0021BDFF0D|nr:SNF2 helicase associated domain-containing protein [Clostridium sp. CX1]MCT8977049.1 SNF2 helicase associated domain-containing protein [Clostridium sp. CX1]
MKEDILLQIFNEETSGKNYANGQRVFNNDLVSSIDITNEDKLICIDGNVISENLFNEYNTKIEMDGEKKKIFSTYCSCLDYEKNEFKKINYCCKHLVATFYKALEKLVDHPLLAEETIYNESIFKNKSNLLNVLLGDEYDKEEIKIEVYINRNEWSGNITAEFKIGLKSMSSSNLYILKDINQFLIAIYNNIPINYGKNFTLDIKNQRLSVKDKRLIDYIETLKEIKGNNKTIYRSEDSIINGKYVNIPKFLVREFFENIKKHKVYLNEGFFYRPVETEILNKIPPIDFDLKLINGEYVLKSPGGMPQDLGCNNNIFLYGMSVYIPDYEFCYKISPYLQIFNEAKVIKIDASEEENILRKLIPQINMMASTFTLSKTIKEKVVIDKCNFNFYFDREEEDITLTVKVLYGNLEFNIFEDYKEKIVYRDSKKESQVIGILRSLGFEEIKGKFYLLMEEDYIFRFFKREINKLQEIGEVYYSENFKGIKSIGSKGITGNIKSGRYDYFELNFKIGDINPEETAEILRAFRDNLKYYKLKNGEYIDLEELELNKFLKLLDIASSKDIDDNCIQIPSNKGLFLNNYLEENSLRFIKGKKALKEIKDKFKNIENLSFKEPEDLEGNLRAYQKVGYNWFKTLDFLGFGGILGDEMGLGKTLQTITFILSNKGSKSLIVAPTSLIYNWAAEFEKFAPKLKIAVVNGSKEDREELIKKVDDYDVLITTYNLLKRDLESYTNIEFDYCILDEAQNIKNPSSQNAAAVKEIKAKRRFALSGTPIENSLMELWSIFDFIMPGYLYDEKRFSVRYHKKLRESPEVLEDLNRLIKPFILRRKKKDVIKELPDKIEKNLVVNLDEEQKKVYRTYANYAVELIQKKVKNYEFQNSKIEILSYITKLRQLCLDPSVIMKDYSGGSGKIEALVELIQESLEQGHRALIFSQFTSVLKNIGKRINAEGIAFSYLDGSIPSEKRMDMVKAFNDGENSVFLISLKAGGTGLNLTSADLVIHFDPWWNPAVEEQATDRAHRIGQRNVVEVIKIIAKDTIEEKILLLQEEKKKLISEILGEELSSGENFSSLTEEEILGLFEI